MTLRVTRSAERALRRGHPWLYADGIRSQSHAGTCGDLAVVFDARRAFLAIGLYDPDSNLRVRVLQARRPAAIDADFLRARIAAARARREPLEQRSDTDAWRVVHGENDALPGVVVDRYGDAYVLELHTPAWVPWLDALRRALCAELEPALLVLRWSRAAEARGVALGAPPSGTALVGTLPAAPLHFREHGLVFECDPVRGQKTGFFLDQRDNRARVERHAAGRTVLNVFGYTGGFSVHAARGGARSVVTLDQSAPALEAAGRNFEANRRAGRIPADVPHERLRGDAFEQLAALRERGARFGLIVLDPPAFAHRRDQVPAALSAYTRLAGLGLDLLEPDGVLVAASCSAPIAADDFFATVHDAARRSGRALRELERTGHAADHPIGFPEGAYLKALFTCLGRP